MHNYNKFSDKLLDKMGDFFVKNNIFYLKLSKNAFLGQARASTNGGGTAAAPG